MAAESVKNPFVDLFPFEAGLVRCAITLILGNDALAVLEHFPQKIALPVLLHLLDAATALELRDVGRNVVIFIRVAVVQQEFRDFYLLRASRLDLDGAHAPGMCV